MAKQLKLFNGSGYCIAYNKIPAEYKANRYYHIFACGHSIADVSRLINEFNGYEGDRMINYHSEISKYWSKNCWGNPMKDVTPERGLWVTWEDKPNAKPVRVL